MKNQASDMAGYLLFIVLEVDVLSALYNIYNFGAIVSYIEKFDAGLWEHGMRNNPFGSF